MLAASTSVCTKTTEGYEDVLFIIKIHLFNYSTEDQTLKLIPAKFNIFPANNLSHLNGSNGLITIHRLHYLHA